MDIIGNLVNRKSEVETAEISSHKTGDYYVVESGNVSYIAKSVIGSVSIGIKVLILATESTKYIIGTDKGASGKRKEIIVDG